MYQQIVQEITYTFIFIVPHTALSTDDEKLNPYTSCPGFLHNLVYTGVFESEIVIEEKRLVSHVAFYERPAGTFGIRAATTVLVNSLHHNRDVY